MRNIPLTKGMFAIIDEEDFEKVNKYKWYAHESMPGQFYARHDFPNRKRVFLHRFIMDANDPKIQVDHLNGNKLDNRRGNLRAATNQENSRNQSKLRSHNTSGYRGVHFTKRTGKFVAYIKLPDRKRKHLGTFDNAESAAKAFDKAAVEIYREFCGRLNYE